MKYRSPQSAHRTRTNRLWALGILFGVVALVYIIWLAVLELNGENIHGHKQDGTTSRTVIVQAVRGQIYDRNGVPLVKNEYAYDLTLDYSVLPTEPEARNRTILGAFLMLESCGEGDHFCAHRFPFDGTYPDLTYSASAADPTSSTHQALLSVFENNGLKRAAILEIKRDHHMTTAEAKEYFSRDPLACIPAADLVSYFISEYHLIGADRDRKPLYTEAHIDRLIRVYWGMEATGFSRANDYVMAKDIRMDTVTHEKELGLSGVGFATTARRVYTHPGYASHILGQTGPIYAEEWPYYKELGYNMNAIVGKSGCESAFESYLHGQDGVKVIVEDKDGRIVDEHMKTEPVAGKDVYLTIDIDLQMAAEAGLEENIHYIQTNFGRKECKAGAVTAVDPHTGEVLAIASYPTYNLATYHEDYGSLEADPALPLLNRALNGVYVPGSTFKPGMVAAALNENVITADTKFECTGKYTYYKSYQPECWIYRSPSSPTHQHGWINAAEALRVSCNCFFYETGRRLGIDRMNLYCRMMGLGEHTGIELGEQTGSLAGPDFREENHGVEWQPTDTIAAAIGQSDNAFTPLQLSMYLATIANGGTRYAAHLLSRVRDFSTRTDILVSAPEVLNTMPLSDAHRLTIIDGMEQMVATSPEVNRYMQRVPVTVAGKTGTAQLGSRLTDNGLFICCAPSRNPDIVVTSVVERAGGGSYSSMTAGRVLEAFYRKK